MVARKDEQRAKVAELLDSGLPVAEIARHLGLTRQRIYKIALDLGYRFERSRMKPIRPIRSSPYN